MNVLALRSLHAIALSAPLAVAQVSVPPGFTATVISPGIQLTGVAVGDGAAFGSYVYVSGSGVILRVDPVSGAVSTFATGLGISTGRPSGLAFDSGVFGTGALYCVQNNGVVYAFASDASRTTLVTGGALVSSNGLAFAPTGTPFGDLLFVANGNGGSSTVASVTSAGVGATFAAATNYVSSPLGLDFPPAGSAFPRDLYVAVFLSGQLARTDSSGTASVYATGLGQTIGVAFSPDPNGPFGDFAYVTDALGDALRRVDPSGAQTTFATGITMSNYGWDGDVAFAPDGQTLFVAAYTTLVAIRPSCAPPSSYCTGKTNSQGCVPTVASSGSPDVTGASDFVITCSNALELKSGLLFYGFAAAAVPFQGGFLCVQQPVRRTPIQTSLGGGGCGSGYSFAFDDHIRSGIDPLLVAPASVHAQWWMRDPASASTTGLSDALSFQICP